METIKSKSKLQTPVATNRFVPMHTSTTCTKLKKPSISDNSPIPKSYSAMKVSSADFKERELKRQREAEASQKRTAILQAQMEEKRRIRTEKQLKAQQAREAQEKEKLKNVEKLKLKEEKLKQQLIEKDLKLQKQKEELERKRQMAKQKAAEEKKEQEMPIYMTMKAPLLPTTDCYDSDSEEAAHSKILVPKWARGKNLIILPDKILRFFF